MTNVSKQQLDPKELQKLFTQLNGVLGSLNKQKVDGFLSDLLGPEERIMLVKRLAVIIMLMENNSAYRIADTLKVSPATVTTIQKYFDEGRFDHIVSILRKNQTDYKKFWETLEVILRAGMPSQGKDRWKSIFKE
jgi:uncharacterized protein YerC